MTTTATAPPPVSRRRPSLRSDEDRNALVTANINLVYGYLHRKWPRYADDDDAIQAGRLGLIRAAELYDSEKGLAFSTYAETWMRQSVHKELYSRGVIYVPHSRGDRFADDIARAQRVGSFTDAEGRNYDPAAPATLDAGDYWADMEEKLRWAMERMSREDSLFLELRYFNRLGTREIAERIGRSNARIKQIQQSVLRRLSRVLGEKGLFDAELCS